MSNPIPLAVTRSRSCQTSRHCLVLFAVVGLGGCATISKNCPTDPRTEAPWWCAVANVEENVYEGETERREEEIGEERGTLEEAEDAVAAERERLRSAETDNAALTAELDRLRREVQAAEDELAALRAGRKDAPRGLEDT